MKMYVVVEHEWEEKYILGVYSSRKQAEEAVAEALHGGEEWEGWYFDIVEKELE